MTDSSRIVYLVVGGTGKQGRAVIDALLSDSSPKVVRFLTRSPNSASSKKLIQSDSRLNAYAGDLLDPASLEVALDGVDRAFLVTNPTIKGESTEAQQGKNFIDAAKKRGVKHIVFTSVCDADKAKDVPHFVAKYEVEEYLEASGIPYTVTRPVAFMDNFPAAGLGRYLMLGAFFAFCGWKTCQFIAVEDIGIVGGKALLSPDSPDFKNKKIDLTAGEFDIYQTLDAFEKGQGVKPWYAWFMPTQLIYLLPYDAKQMFFYFRNHGYSNVDQTLVKKVHPDLLTFDQWAAKAAGKKSE